MSNYLELLKNILRSRKKMTNIYKVALIKICTKGRILLYYIYSWDCGFAAILGFILSFAAYQLCNLEQVV